jgi:hypothetical protein
LPSSPDPFIKNFDDQSLEQTKVGNLEQTKTFHTSTILFVAVLFLLPQSRSAPILSRASDTIYHLFEMPAGRFYEKRFTGI